LVQVTAVHLEGGTLHQHIASVRWINPQTQDTGTSTRQVMVDWLRTLGNRAVVFDGVRTVEVAVVNANPPYIRTHADGVWTDNLLSLSRF
jgi:hypothetical protein